MDGAEVLVWADRSDSFELVGTIRRAEVPVFCYDEGYAGPSLIPGMPADDTSFDAHRTATYFGALIPEGQTEHEFRQILHAGRTAWLPLLERLGDEVCGALVFTDVDIPPGEGEAYELVGCDFFERLAREPGPVTVDTLGRTRVSVTGAMRKVAMLFDDVSGQWAEPRGGAPTTHIIKVPDEGRYPLETINEAICLTLARLCGIETEEFALIQTETSPLLAVRRFDRPIPDEPHLVCGMARPRRLHQLDFCQFADTSLKYEPSGGHYLTLAARLVRTSCDNAFGDAMGLLCNVFFDYLVGNCDNHLKNFSVLLDEGMRRATLSPAYDVLDTTVYGRLSTEMGVPLSFDRLVTDVTRSDVTDAIRHAGYPENLAWAEFETLADDAVRAFPKACELVVQMGFADEVERLEGPMGQGLRDRASFSYTEGRRVSVDGQYQGKGEHKIR